MNTPEDFKLETGKSAVVLIAQYFGMKGRVAMEEIGALNSTEKVELARGIFDGTLTY